MFGVPPNTLPLVIYIGMFCYWVLLQYNMSFKTIAGGFNSRQIMHVCACIQGQIMHDVREEPLDILHRGPQDRVRYIQVASRAQSALFRPTNAQATVHCLFYTTSPSYWAAPQNLNFKSQ